jgi:multidrug resistance efflux pump
MTSAMTTTLDHTPAWPRALRLLLSALALVVLLAASFAIGHVTGSSHQGPATSSAQIQAPVTAIAGTGAYCQVGHLRGPC